MPDGRLTEEPDAVLILFADLLGITVTQEQSGGRLHVTDECVPDDIGLLRHVPAVTVSCVTQSRSPCKCDSVSTIRSLRQKINYCIQNLRFAAVETTLEVYARHIDSFMCWLHMQWPECFRKTPVSPQLS